MTRPGTLYHGTAREGLIGKTILPVDVTGMPATFPSDTDRGYAYATVEPSTAWHYAELAWNAASVGIPRVYEVAPVDGADVEDDPTHDARGNSRGNFPDDRRSRAGFLVIRELPMPDDMGDPDDWR